jgi:hypothetical protein
MPGMLVCSEFRLSLWYSESNLKLGGNTKTTMSIKKYRQCRAYRTHPKHNLNPCTESIRSAPGLVVLLSVIFSAISASGLLATGFFQSADLLRLPQKVELLAKDSADEKTRLRVLESRVDQLTAE